MSTPALNDYNRVAYPSMAHPQTFAKNLAVKGWLRGIDVAPPDRCRVLELGCGDGFNLAAMAMAHPECQYVGVDYATEAVTRGRQMLAELGLKQIRLEAADIRKLDPGLGEFDYILAHGVYSWVPDEVRDRLLQVIARHLAPRGVAFVSYLALPGAYMRETARTIMRFHARTVSDPADQIRQARSALHLAAHSTTEPNLYTQLIAGEWRSVDSRSDEGLFHDELSEISAPVLFTEFLEHANRHQLAFLSEAEYLLPLGRLTEEAREQLRPLEQNRVLLEQYLDFIDGRRFRQTLLCHRGQGEKLATERLDRLHVRFGAKQSSGSSELSASEPVDFHGLRKSMLRAKTPWEKAVLLELASWGWQLQPYPTLLPKVELRLRAAGIAIDPTLDATLRRYLIQSNVDGLVEFSWSQSPAATSAPAQPETTALARWQLAHNSNFLISLAGKVVEIKGGLGRHLLSLLDGTRDRAALLAQIKVFLDAARAEDSASSSSPPPDDPALLSQLETSLQGLAELELIYAK